MALKLPANRSDRRQVAGVYRKRRVVCFRSDNEQLNRAVIQNMSGFLPTIRRKLKRYHAMDVLAVDVQQLATCHEDDDARAMAQQRLDEFRRGVYNMFATIEHQQKVQSVDGSRDGFRANIRPTEAQLKRLSHGGRNHRGIGERRKLDKPRAIIEITLNAAGDIQSKNGLPDPTGSGQGHRAMGPEKIPHLPQGRRSADQTLTRRGQITPGGFFAYRYFLPTDGWPRRIVMPDGPFAEQAGIRNASVGAGCFAICHGGA